MSVNAPGLVSVIIPTYKESENIRLLIPRIGDVMKAAGLAVEVIIVDDNSRDGIEQVVAQFTKAQLPVKLEVRMEQRGLSTAVIHGFKLAKGDYLVCMDADFSHPPEKIPELISKLRSGEVDFVIGSRYVPGAATDVDWGLFRWLNSKIAAILARPLVSVKDPMSGFFALRKETFLSTEHLSPIGYKIAMELLVKSSCKKIVEVPIHFADRKFGKSKLNLTEQLNYVKHLKRLYDYKYNTHSRFFQFCLVGITGAGVDLICFNLVLPMLKVFALARVVAIYIAMTWNFYLNRRVTFHNARGEHWHIQYFKFIAGSFSGAVINWTISIMLAHIMPGTFVSVQIAVLGGIVCGTLVNFLLAYNVAFRKRKKLI